MIFKLLTALIFFMPFPSLFSLDAYNIYYRNNITGRVELLSNNKADANIRYIVEKDGNDMTITGYYYDSDKIKFIDSIKDRFLYNSTYFSKENEIFNGKGQASKTNFQMKPKNILQNVLSLEDTNCTKGCPMCDNMRVGIKGELVKLYKESKEVLLDFNELSEHNMSTLNGMYIISKKLLLTFIDENILPHKDIEVHPVEFV